jgi:predicted RND superfamily exporter protein
MITGIGIDNMFVLLSSWRHTSYLLPVEERMAATFEQAAVSITLTSLTDVLAFGIGAYTSFLSIELFCAYTGLAVVFCYINTITFLAAVMALSGRNEEKNMHEFACRKATPKEAAGSIQK